eukprot:8299236-Karenia_brevis.AAC.1
MTSTGPRGRGGAVMYDLMCMPCKDRREWKTSASVKDVFQRARGQTHMLSQKRVMQDEGAMHSMFEKLPYWWTHEAMMNTMILNVFRSLQTKKSVSASCVCSDASVKLAFAFTHVRLARGYNALDCEIEAGAWKGREGRQVRAHVGAHADLPNKLEWSAQRALRACCGPVIYADTLGLHVARFQHVYSSLEKERQMVLHKLRILFQYMEGQGWGVIVEEKGQWPAFLKAGWEDMDRAERSKLAGMHIPRYAFPLRCLDALTMTECRDKRTAEVMAMATSGTPLDKESNTDVSDKQHKADGASSTISKKAGHQRRHHFLPIQKRWKDAIDRKEKDVEARINIGRAAQIRAGDVISLSGTDRQVVAIQHFPDFHAFLQVPGMLERALPGVKTVEEAVAIYHSFPFYERRAAEHGVCVFLLSLCGDMCSTSMPGAGDAKKKRVEEHLGAVGD